MIKFALIKEEKTPPDRRVVFSPEKLKELVKKFPEANFKVQSSEIRIFNDQEYRDAGFEVTEDISDCEVLLGVKEVPLPALIPNKKYFFFSHTIKKQPYNQDLLREILKLNIELYDHEVIVKENGARLIGFGRYAGLVGAYNGFRGIGLKENLFNIPKVESLPDLDAMLAELDKIEIPLIKIVLTGNGKVAKGAKEVLDHLGIKKLNVEDYLKFEGEEPVYCNIGVLDYNKKKDFTKGSQQEFFKEPEKYEANFLRFARSSDFFISGHFYGDRAPVFFTAEDAKSKDFRIKYIADISCDIKGPIASTIRPSTIAEPFYGYNPETETEVDFREKDSILVMAVDNLPCELPKDASEGFGEMFLKHVIPAFFNDDKDGVLDRARMTQNGKLTPKFGYLQDYVERE
ncbi:alanine dehydrogenase [Salegentibacter salinarum]|uniref:Saccharopine dehydrogenase [NAD(+), L-lysine-forming] n=1 Tax=Salegentibacter salinarum TaxID=447422 RepID=A0A2N0U0L5_9FLAO|nr:NAD(P)-dependent oxidoreductase [Salegentibacter salinarum]PKD20466.1 alanine dehydrogenase [Salegentibacter salinarum]SKB85132.1 Alanine dehydrogenase [Salegentibacter salinarum]